MMEIRQLRYFVAMAEAGSLAKASERLNISQPALSVHLANLEAELGTTLVTRSNRGVELTEDGKLLLDRAIVLLRYHRETERALKDRSERPSGSVSPGPLPTSSEMLSAQPKPAIPTELPDSNL